MAFEPISQGGIHAGLPAGAAGAKHFQHVAIETVRRGFLESSHGSTPLLATGIDASLYLFPRKQAVVLVRSIPDEIASSPEPRQPIIASPRR